MEFQKLIVIAFSLLLSSTGLAHPLQTSIQPITSVPGLTILPRFALDSSPYPNIFNASRHPFFPPPNTPIYCFAEGTYTNVTSCRPTLNHFRTFPAYRKIQPFLENSLPKLPNKPPLIIYHKQSTCAVEIAASSPTIEDRFSFEQVRGLATEIVEDCQNKGGFGGYAAIGRGEGWVVRVIGFNGTEAALVGNGTVMVEGAGLVGLVDADAVVEARL